MQALKLRAQSLGVEPVLPASSARTTTTDSSKTPANKPEHLVATNPTPPSPTTLSHTASVPSSFSSSSMNFPRTPQSVFVPSRPPAIRRGLTKRKIILFVGLLLLVVGGSLLFGPSVINSLVKFS